MPTVRVNGAEMYYVEAGSGDPMILIMGFGGDHLAWGFQFRAFAEKHRVIAFDNRGAGQTEAPDAPFTIRTMAEDTAGLMGALGIERAHVVGVSMGGMIAQELALAHPGRVRSLHLGCTTARADAYMRALIAAQRELRESVSRETMIRSFNLWLFSPTTYEQRPQFVDMIVQTALANPYPQTLAGFVRQGDAIAGHDTVERLPALRCPTLVSVADDDILVPPRFSREVAARIPGATLRTFAGAGHAYFWELAEEFNALCLEFAAKH